MYIHFRYFKLWVIQISKTTTVPWKKTNKRAMMALDRSPESFSPKMDSTSLPLVPTSDSRGRASFDPTGHQMNKIEKRSTRRCYIPKIYALSVPVSEKKNFEVGLLSSYVPTCDIRRGVSFYPKKSYE